MTRGLSLLLMWRRMEGPETLSHRAHHHPPDPQIHLPGGALPRGLETGDGSGVPPPGP